VSFTLFPKLAALWNEANRGRARTDVLRIPSSANAFRSEHREFPGAGSLIVADEILITVCAFQLEISVVGRQPGVEYLRDGYPMVTKNQRAWRLLPAMACVALNTDAEHPLFTHLIFTAQHWHDRSAEGITASTSWDRS
jgi:hypothetical protein